MLDICIHVMNSTYSTLHQASTDDIELQVGGLRRFCAGTVVRQEGLTSFLSWTQAALVDWPGCGGEGVY